MEPARRILNGVSHIEQEVLSVRGLESGTLRAGSFPSAAVRMLPKIMSAFSRLHPNIEIVLFEGSDQEVLAWLDSRAIDVGVIAQSAVGPGMTLLAKDKMVAILPQDRAQRYGPVVTVATLDGQPFIMSSGGCEPLIRELFAHAGCAPAVRFAVHDTETILNMVREGLGITVMPEMALPDRLPDVVVKALEPDSWRYLGLRSSSDEVTPSVRAFVALAQSLFSPAEGDTTSGVNGPPVPRLSQKVD
ncbi:MAG: LysR family transcriptional regulator substrate-binding protein [Thermaerobacter sp.]|nr:LysR family transcriptional regulator substrate-binding protein [Thermaerobacter sp.]